MYVAIVGIDDGKAEEAVNELRELGAEVITIRTDVIKTREVNAMVKIILENFETIYIAISVTIY